ncbi:SDR family NAD(P)-dependent oxidoreductase [Phytoactinopolyspora limicola]|uniref:SDR family NAD(P)-dependent oxidoreductase n=1 Tax=Phytoactinopolyspora limicola TaxID=2715536 RepID=UPI001408C616|nr:SDR family oxidoreductase [Phytoactinopolyspora limicola]
MRASFDARGDVVVVTGGGAGIGAALAGAVADAGGTAVVLDIEPRGPDQAAQARAGVDLVRVDVSDRPAVHAAIDDVVRRHGTVTGLVAGAAVQPRTRVIDMAEEEWHRVRAVNLDGVVWACQAVLPTMVAARHGSIVLFSSGLAHAGRAEAAAYAASKGAMVPFAKSLAAEVADHRVRVNVLFPGVIDTDQFRRANSGPEREHWAGSTGIGAPEDVVGSLLFLLSDAATMTGSTLSRDRAFAASPHPSEGAP